MERQVVVEMIFGSHLYGTDTPESDRDYKGVMLPTREEILLSRIPKCIHEPTKCADGKNTKFDVDRDWYSLQYFIDLAKAGDTGILDMLHAPPETLLQTTEIWRYITDNRHKFYTKSLKALIGYSRRQAAKYGIKGSRLNDIKQVLAVLSAVDDKTTRLTSIWEYLPEGEHIHKLPSDDERFQFYQVAGRKFLERMKVGDVLESITNVYEQSGGRAKDAAENKNIDWKALSHAIRAAYEIIEILEHQTITFPLIEAEYVKQVKNGELDYIKEVAPTLEYLIDKCEALAVKSNLPERVDHDFWNNFVMDTVEKHILKIGEHTC
jgi:hypothetical protein